VQHLAQKSGVSTSTAWKICPDDLSLIPCKMQLSQLLSEDGKARRYAFAKKYGALLEDNPGVLNVTRSSDEAHFRLSASGNPVLTVANPLH
jgi:hypothetical protein